MLKSLFISNYYAWVKDYWTQAFNSAETNIEADFANFCLSSLSDQILRDDTSENQNLVDAEQNHLSTYLAVYQGLLSNMNTVNELTSALSDYQESKANRKAILPKIDSFVTVINKQASNIYDTYHAYSNVDIYPDYRPSVLAAQRISTSVKTFLTQVSQYVSLSETEIDNMETTKQVPLSYQDILDKSPYVFDGTYSDNINHVSPEGNLYGQTTTVQVVEHLYWWTGAEWELVPDVLDQAASVDLLPNGEDFGTIFRIPKVNATGDGYIYDYYYSTGSAWVLMNEYWAVEGVSELPSPGYNIGDYHKVIERSVTVKWDGYEWQRLNMSEFADNIGLAAGIAGLTTNQTTLENSHNELLASYLGDTNTGNTLLDAIAVEKAAFIDLLDSFSDSGYITLAESFELKKHLAGVVSESVTLIATARTLEGLVAELDLSELTDDYSEAITDLDTALDSWVDATAYPVEITGAVSSRATIDAAIEAVRVARAALFTAIQNSNVDYVDAQILEVGGAVSDVQDAVDLYANDGYISLAEANELTRLNAHLDAESDDIIAIAVGLAPVPEPNPKSAITLAKEAYSAALLALTNALTSWTTNVTYPLEIKDLVTTKAAMQSALADVASTKAALTVEIQGVNAQNLSDVSGDLGELQSDVDDFSTDLTLMLSEANSLTASFNTLTIGYNNIVSAAGACDPVVNTDLITAAYNALHSAIDTTWIGQASYPVTLAAGDRAALQLLLQDYEEHRFLTESDIAAANVGDPTAAISQAITDFRLSIYNGFIKGFTPDLELVYVNKNELTLRPKETGDYDLKEILKKTAVFTYTPILDYTTPGGVITLAQSEIIESNNEVGNPPPYNVYLANQHADFETSIYDYRGKLFCSNHTHSNNYWVDDDGDFEAILVGTVTTIPETIDGITKIIFEQGINTSLISQESDVKETFREYSDFDLEYTDETTLTLARIYGARGQMYVPESLYYLGESRTLSNSDWIINVSGVDGTLSLGSEGAAASTLYYVYIGSDTDIYNFNTLAGTTPDRPLHPGETGYVAGKDFRLSMFLSTTIPDNGRLAQTYYGYWARHIGQILTDAGGKFVYSGNVSAIRQATLNPTYLDGLAEVSIESGSSTSFKVVKKRGTSGVVMVGARGVVTPTAGYTITTSDPIYTYDEEDVNFDPTDPLVDTTTILDTFIGTEKYLYLANDRPCWGALAGQTFLCNVDHTAGYLSQNYPGNNARWIATIKLAVGTKGLDLVTNGNFMEGVEDWVSEGWTWVEADRNVTCDADGVPLEQEAMTVEAGSIYEVALTASGFASGCITPKIGNTLGDAITSAQRSVQYIKATNTDVLKIVPDPLFSGAVDTVTAFKIESGAFSGNYITDSITKEVPVIDNYDIGTNILWDSVKIMQVINDALGVSGTTSVLNAQKTGGLNLRLEYVNTTTVRLIPSSGTDSYVVFPDLSAATIPAAGITMTVAGAANTRYYVYLSIGTGSGALSMSSANAPNDLYTKLETYGTANIQVGDICMTAPNAMTGAWNVCSSHQEIPLSWSTAINAADVVAINVVLNLPGLIVGRRAKTTVTRTGSTTLYASFVWNVYWGSYYNTCTVTVGSNSCDAYPDYVIWRGHITVALSEAPGVGIAAGNPTYSETIYGERVGDYPSCYGHEVHISARDGNLVLTRS